MLSEKKCVWVGMSGDGLKGVPGLSVCFHRPGLNGRFGLWSRGLCSDWLAWSPVGGAEAPHSSGPDSRPFWALCITVCILPVAVYVECALCSGCLTVVRLCGYSALSPSSPNWLVHTRLNYLDETMCVCVFALWAWTFPTLLCSGCQKPCTSAGGELFTTLSWKNGLQSVSSSRKGGRGGGLKHYWPAVQLNGLWGHLCTPVYFYLWDFFSCF